jgi:hypothetical protein
VPGDPCIKFGEVSWEGNGGKDRSISDEVLTLLLAGRVGGVHGCGSQPGLYDADKDTFGDADATELGPESTSCF